MPQTKLEQMEDRFRAVATSLIALFTSLVEVGAIPADRAPELLEDVIEPLPPKQQENARRALAYVLQGGPLLSEPTQPLPGLPGDG